MSTAGPGTVGVPEPELWKRAGGDVVVDGELHLGVEVGFRRLRGDALARCWSRSRTPVAARRGSTRTSSTMDGSIRNVPARWVWGCFGLPSSPTPPKPAPFVDRSLPSVLRVSICRPSSGGGREVEHRRCAEGRRGRPVRGLELPPGRGGVVEHVEAKADGHVLGPEVEEGRRRCPRRSARAGLRAGCRGDPGLELLDAFSRRRRMPPLRMTGSPSPAPLRVSGASRTVASPGSSCSQVNSGSAARSHRP